MIAGIIDSISVLYIQNKIEKLGNKRLNRVVSDVAESVSNKTPIINHELINRHNITAQSSKARNIIIDDIFHSRQFEQYSTGTSAESTAWAPRKRMKICRLLEVKSWNLFMRAKERRTYLLL